MTFHRIRKKIHRLSKLAFLRVFKGSDEKSTLNWTKREKKKTIYQARAWRAYCSLSGQGLTKTLISVPLRGGGRDEERRYVGEKHQISGNEKYAVIAIYDIWDWFKFRVFLSLLIRDCNTVPSARVWYQDMSLYAMLYRLECLQHVAKHNFWPKGRNVRNISIKFLYLRTIPTWNIYATKESIFLVPIKTGLSWNTKSISTTWRTYTDKMFDKWTF